jgi:hypothetical protein
LETLLRNWRRSKNNEMKTKVIPNEGNIEKFKMDVSKIRSILKNN